MQTNLQSIFNNLQITLFVARRDVESARGRVEGLDLEDAEASIIQVEGAINEALETLKECRTELSTEQLTKFA